MSMTTGEMIAVIEAHKAGKTIECRATPLGLARSPHAKTLRDWGDPQNNPPLFNFAFYDYRVAPEPLELWVNVYSAPEPRYAFYNETEANEFAGPRRIRCAHMREVTE